MSENEDNKLLLPHHEQKSLCTTRLPYRQGRKLTAVKVYTVNNESNHLLVFGVPSLNLRQETKSLFLKFGRVSKIHVTTEHKTEQFTDTYHIAYDNVQSARIAKRMLDTKTFYGGSLHVCYAPEYETFEETKAKLLKRRRDVVFRLNKLKNEVVTTNPIIENEPIHNDSVKMNMGNFNTISFGNGIEVIKRNKKRKIDSSERQIKKNKSSLPNEQNEPNPTYIGPIAPETINEEITDVIDCTSTEFDTITNMNDSLNYSNFGNEIIRKVPEKPLNKVKFVVNISNKIL